MNRNTSVTDAAGKVTKLKYDALNKTQRTDALNQVTTYLYDNRNRLTNVVYASGTSANSQRTYAYDLVGNLLSVTEPTKTAANVAYTYDALNRVTAETSGGLTHTYAYDLVGNRIQTVYGGTTRTIASTYDALNRLSTMTESGRTTSYGYDLNGNIAQKTLPNGDSETTSFDPLNRDTIQSAQTGGAVSLYNFQYAYDLAGNLVINTESYPGGLEDRTVTNTYDTIDRLTQEAVSAAVNVTTVYAYDSANNRTSKAVTGGSGAGTTNYTYNNLNQLTGYTSGTRSVVLTYDYDGNRISRVVTGGTDNGTDTYSYDFENRLIDLVKGTSGGAGTYAYTYDYRTRRITRDESSAGGATTAIVFSGGTSVQEYDNGATTPTVEYIRGSDYGGGVGGILYTLRTVSGSLTPSYTHENRRGDVVAKTSSTGSLTYQAQYEAFGNQVGTSGSTPDRQASNTQDQDPTALSYDHLRYLDHETGTWITRDPSGLSDGPNLYTYVRQNPYTYFDPTGLLTMILNGQEVPWTMENQARAFAQNFSTFFGKPVIQNIRNDATLAHEGAVVATSGKTTIPEKMAGAAVTVAAVTDLGTMVTPEGGLEDTAGHVIANDAGKTALEAGTKAAFTPGTKSAADVIDEDNEFFTVFRGVSSDHAGYADALQGKANPIGGHADPMWHNTGDTDSEFTSWTLKPSVAYKFATTSTEDELTRTHGVILQDRVAFSKLTLSPDEHEEVEVLRRGPIEGAQVQIVPKPKN